MLTRHKRNDKIEKSIIIQHEHSNFTKTKNHVLTDSLIQAYLFVKKGMIM